MKGRSVISNFDNGSSTKVAATGVPVIDISGFLLDSEERDAVIADVRAACERVGFFVITDHGVSIDLVSRMYGITHQFFRQSAEVKAQSASPTGYKFRGFSQRLAATANGMRPVAEAFEVGRFDDAAAILSARYDLRWTEDYEANVWPATPEGFPNVWMEYYEAMADLAARLMNLLAAALELPVDWFADKFDRHVSYMAANHYLEQPYAPSEGEFRRAAHTDTGSLTILYQDGAPGGLQVCDRDGRWSDVPAVPESFVINLGDLLAKWTNDRWVATEHRVINPSRDFAATDRISIPYFQHPNFDAIIECIPSCTSEDDPPRYAPVLAGDWSKYRETKEPSGAAAR